MIVELNDVAQDFIQSIKRTERFHEAKMALMKIEIQLGAEERAAYDSTRWSYIPSALDSVWTKVAEAFVAHVQYLAASDRALRARLSASAEEIESDLMENALEAAVAATLRKPSPLCFALARPESSAFVSAASYNKRYHDGLQDEIACLRLLLAHQKDVNLVLADSEGYTPLHLMAYMRSRLRSHPRAVRLLLNAGAQVDAQNSFGDTPLSLVSACADFDENIYRSMSLLLDAGADPHLKANDGMSAYTVLKMPKATSGRKYVQKLLRRIEQAEGLCA